MDITQASPTWLALPGAKCEIDRSIGKASSACSLTADVAHGEIDDVAGGAPVDSVFTSDQLVFLGSLAGQVDFASLARLGPIPSTVWKIAPPELIAPVSIERWLLPDDTTIIEVSTRVPPGQADAAASALQAWLGDRGVVLAAEQGTKTRAALAAFAP
jgi:hypothetical protein